MTTKRLQPTVALLERLDRAFLDHGYAALSMVGLAKACDLSVRALYYYFKNKEEAFRASMQFGNDLGLAAGFAAGQAMRENGGSALDVLAEIVSVRYGLMRRKANASPHGIELSVEVSKRCKDLVIGVVHYFESELTKVVIELQEAKLLTVRAGITPEQVARTLANGARGINQRLPPVLPGSYREMCSFILSGSVDLPPDAVGSSRHRVETKRKH